MELVYLWIEKYKNIKKQGFNFSPRFKCEFKDKYDENSKLKDNCKLIIEENKDYVNIFPENINITAIVGENGAGKSTILKFLKELLYSGTKNFKTKNSFILVTHSNKNFFYRTNLDIKCDKAIKHEILGFYNHYLYLPNEQIPSTENYRTDEIIPNRFSMDNTIIARMLTSKYIANVVDFELTTFMYLPKQIEVKPISLFDMFTELTDKYAQGFGIPIDLNKNMTDRQEEKAYKDARNETWAKKDDLDNIFNEADDDFHRFLIIWYIKNHGDDNYEISNKNYLLKEYQEEVDSINEEEFELYSKKEIREINKFTEKDKNFYFNFCKDFFEFNFIDSENRKFNDLSHGEQTLFAQFLNMYYFSLFGYKNIKDNELIFLLDEPDLSLHPQWQKNYLFEAVSLLNKLNPTYNVLITTHSPFILSDLPKENVIFLKKDEENGNCINDTDNLNINPFGANIHTLLSHGFFMKDGLMGEFAKNKISKILKFLSGENKFIDLEVKILPPLKIQNNFFEKNLKPIIEFIGEDFLKEKLLKMYEIKFPKSNEAKIKELKNEIKRLKNASN